MADKKLTLTFNGIDGSTGNYLLPSLSMADLSKIALGDTLDRNLLSQLRLKSKIGDTHLGVRPDIDPTKVSEAGWGIVIPQQDTNQYDLVREALSPLLEMRRRQAGDFYKGPLTYRTGESKNKFLSKYGKGPGPADPKKVPYYLLLVGSPEEIPFRIQYLLGVDYAVGRIHFEKIEDYAKYAESVVAAENGRYTRNRHCAFFGVQNRGDRATNMSAKYLVTPLSQKIASDNPDWTIATMLKEECTKSRLSNLLENEDGPALIFTASHGMGFPKGHPLQLDHQGALLCQDWPGPLMWNGEIPPEQYFSGDDLDGANVAGMIAFHFACYGAGTPLIDDFAHKAFSERINIADRPFVAQLPKQMLSHGKGSALAVVGHVERAWGYSFAWPGIGADLQAFEDTLTTLMNGAPIGHAMEFFAHRYASIATELEVKRELIYDEAPEDAELAGLWTANNDARSYVISGDPYVRLNV